MSRVGHGKSRACHGWKTQKQSMFTRVVTASRLQNPMCHPLSHQSAVKADLSRRNGVKAEAGRRRKRTGGGSQAKAGQRTSKAWLTLPNPDHIHHPPSIIRPIARTNPDQTD